jgi:hypothetical protein
VFRRPQPQEFTIPPDLKRTQDSKREWDSHRLEA